MGLGSGLGTSISNESLGDTGGDSSGMENSEDKFLGSMRLPYSMGCGVVGCNGWSVSAESKADQLSKEQKLKGYHI